MVEHITEITKAIAELVVATAALITAIATLRSTKPRKKQKRK